MSESSASDGGGAVDHANALRPRYQGSCADLTKVLMPFVAAKTNFIIYSEEEKPSKAKLNKKNVASHYPLLEALRSIQPNLCFSKKLLEERSRSTRPGKAWPQGQGQGRLRPDDDSSLAQHDARGFARHPKIAVRGMGTGTAMDRRCCSDFWSTDAQLLAD